MQAEERPTGISSAIFFRLRDFQPANHTKKIRV